MIKPTCADCGATLHSMFTGIVIMINGKQQKTVCGFCAAQLEVKGWKEVAKAK